MKNFKETYDKYRNYCELKKKNFTIVDPKHILNEILNSISMGNFEKAKEIFCHPKFKDSIDIHQHEDLILAEACKKGDLDFIRYLIEERGANIYAQNGVVFGNLILWKCENILEYLIFDYKIEETLEIKEICEMFFSANIKKMFQKRKLDAELAKKSGFERKIKI